LGVLKKCRFDHARAHRVIASLPSGFVPLDPKNPFWEP